MRLGINSSNQLAELLVSGDWVNLAIDLQLDHLFYCDKDQVLLIREKQLNDKSILQHGHPIDLVQEKEV